MKKFTIFFSITAGLAFTYSCKKDPLACASADKTSALTDESITFTSCSENSERIAWDYGDGTTDEGNSVSHAYSKEGTYLVKMSAYSKKDKDWDKTAMVVTVSDPPPPSKRYLSKIVVKSFAQLNGSDKWDNNFIDTSDPDIYIYFKTSAGEFSKKTSYVTNASQSTLPITYNLAASNIYLSDESWDFEIRDDDDLGGGNVFDSMYSWTINPATNAATNGIITLATGSYAIDIYFEER